MLRHLDLFSGIGGFALAAQWVGGICTSQFVEIDPFCQRLLAKISLECPYMAILQLSLLGEQENLKSFDPRVAAIVLKRVVLINQLANNCYA